MQETMLKILKNIKNSLFILIFLTINVEAKNSKDVSNFKVQIKNIAIVNLIDKELNYKQ